MIEAHDFGEASFPEFRKKLPETTTASQMGRKVVPGCGKFFRRFESPDIGVPRLAKNLSEQSRPTDLRHDRFNVRRHIIAVVEHRKRDEGAENGMKTPVQYRSMDRLWLASALVLTLLTPATPMSAEEPSAGETTPAPALTAADLPPALVPWVKWATDGAQPRPCLAIDGEAVCSWPGTLSLTLDDSGGTFSQTLFAGRELMFLLPGDAAHWPQAVALDGENVPVLPSSGGPAVVVAPGEHRITGRLAWNTLPDSLTIPAATALVSLSARGRTVLRPVRDAAGTLTLRGGESTVEEEGDIARLRIFRRLQDGHPLWLDSEFRLTVSGRARELRMPGANFNGALPVAVTGDLPARLDADGSLRIQVRPGSFSVFLREKLPAPTNADQPQTFTAPTFDASLSPGLLRASQEIWSFARDGNVREVTFEGGIEVDPARAEAPEGWRALPAVALESGQSLTVTEKRRGAPPAPPDSVSIRREWWLDQDGSRFTVRDQLGGTLQRTLRLSMTPSAELGSATLGEDPQLITGGIAPGIEVRTQQLALSAISRMERASQLPAGGWNVDAASLSTRLNLPPGWRLFAAPGADTASGAWTDGWTPWDFFFLVIIAAAVFKLKGWKWGLVGLVAVTLSYHEAHSPRWSWLLLIAITGVLAIRGAASKVAIRLVWGCLTLTLVLLLIPFLLDQARLTLYPDLHPYAADSRSISEFGLYSKIGDASAPSPAASYSFEGGSEVPASVVENEADAAKASGNARPGDANQSVDSYSNTLSDQRLVQQDLDAYKQDPHALIQTGPGVPSWQWTSHELAWNGPVPEDFRIRLLLIPPWLNRLLGVSRIGFCAALLLALLSYAARAFRATSPPASTEDDVAPESPPSGGSAALVGMLVVFALFLPSARAQEYPPPELLGQLRNKLTRQGPPPLCGESCLTTASGRLTIGGGSLALEIEVHAGAESAWPLPGPLSAWAPEAVALDGKPASGLVRQGDGFLYLRLTPGVHAVRLAGPIPPRDAFTLEFKLPPRRAAVTATGWRVDGPKADGGSEPAWQVSRLMGAGSGAGEFSGGSYATWLEVRRELQIGLDWKVITTVRRLSPGDAPVLAKIPLLKGMLVTGDREVKDDAVQISLGQGESWARFEATLKPVGDTPITLRAPEEKNWSEVWVVRCGPVWQCTANGVPPTARWEGGSAATIYQPWPGEKVTLTFHRPEGLTGVTRTIESARLIVTPGPRLLNTTLDLTLRASRAAALGLTLPAEAELLAVTANGVAQPVQVTAGQLAVNHDAGHAEIHVAWREPHGLALWFRAPKVAIDGGSINNEMTIQLPEKRWLLYALGPAWGPAVLFWGILIVVLLVAWALGRVPTSPLASWEWVLLAVGLTQIPLPLAALITGWFFALAARGRQAIAIRWRFNLVQIVLAGWTLLFLVGLLVAIHAGLMVVPDMQVVGNSSTQTSLHWFQDRAAGPLPGATVISTPLWVYRVMTFAWALWLAMSLLRWLQRGWSDFSAGGAWKSVPKTPICPPALPDDSRPLA